MASIRRKCGSKFYFACFRGPDKSRMQVSTKETNRNRALRVAIALEEAAKGRASRAALFDAYNRLSEELYSAPLRVDTTRAFFEGTIAQRVGEISESSARRYRQVTNVFLEHLGSAADAPFRDVSYAQIIAFRTAVAERTSNSNANAYVKCLRNFFTRALADRVIVDDPTKRLKFLTKEKRAPHEKRRPFTEEELGRLLDAAAATSVEWKWMIVVGSLTGQRLGDIAVMHWGSIKYLGPKLAVWGFVSSKTGRDMVVPLPKIVVERMVAELGGPGPGSPSQTFPVAFKSHQDAKGSSSLSNQFAAIMALGKIQEPRDHKAHKEGRSRSRAASTLGFHSLRHTVTSALMAAGVGREVVMDIVGHDTVEMSEVYTHVDMLRKVAAQAKLLAAIRPLGVFVAKSD